MMPAGGRRTRGLQPVWLALLAFVAGVPASAEQPLASAGERTYRLGILPSGEALKGERAGSTPVEGEAAACVHCHRRSGLGAAEGQSVVPPITARYLYRPEGKTPEDMDYSYVQPYRLNRDPYPDSASVARAIREGVGKGGKPLGYLMPRFHLDDASMEALLQYLRGLSTATGPGVTDEFIHFATIITPDADRTERAGMLDVLEHFIQDKNDFVRGGTRALHSSRDIRFRVTRRWQLHVWDLTGPPDTWEQQLRVFQANEPVFAVLSGLGSANWAPVHRFCEQQALPCLFPNVAAPINAESDFYPVYFSQGVKLEAQLIAARVRQLAGAGESRRIVQVFRAGSAGEEGAEALASALASDRVKLVPRRIAAAAHQQGLVRALEGTTRDDILVLWLPPEDLAHLPDNHDPKAAVFVAGSLGGMENAPLPRSWRSAALMTYPVDLPEQRRFRLDYPLGWFRIRKIPVVAERVQVDTYIACGIVSETLGDMLDSFYRDYLLERIETMLSRRTLTGYYPRLSLAPGQRFASKGGYIVRFEGASGPRVKPEGEWTVP